MKKILIYSAALLLLGSCGLIEEFQPVFTGEYDDPEPYDYVDDSDFEEISTIAELCSLYKLENPEQLGDITIKGRVSTTDQPGNFYKSFYIQDETGGIEIKVGKNGLYNDYLEGQTVYVNCEDLTIGMYGYSSSTYYGGYGMIQIGFSDPSGSYETSYLESSLIVDSHIFRGDPSDIQIVTPYVISSSTELPGKTDTQVTNKYIGSRVTLEGLTYADEAFALLYLDSNKDKKAYSNRVFLSGTNSSDPTCGITTWAMSETKMKEYLYSGVWDECKVGSGSSYLTVTEDDGTTTTVTLGYLKGDGTYPSVEKAAYSVSQYFKMGSTEIQVRTSGYCKFADYEIPADVLSGEKTLNVTGILNLYQGSIQLIVNSLDDVCYADGTPVI